jgi:hypothetical protein
MPPLKPEEGAPPEDAKPPEDGKTAEEKPGTSTGAGKGGAPSEFQLGGLIEATLEELSSYPDDAIENVFTQLDIKYKAVLKEFLDSANSFVDDHRRFKLKQNCWRVSLILLTGGLAILNILAARKWDGATLFGASLSWADAVLPGLAAVYAAFLAIFTNIESYFNYADQKATSRLSRELFLDAYREYDAHWHTYVRPFGLRAQACYNAIILLRRVVTKDAEIRRKVKDVVERPNGANV